MSIDYDLHIVLVPAFGVGVVMGIVTTIAFAPWPYVAAIAVASGLSHMGVVYGALTSIAMVVGGRHDA